MESIMHKKLSYLRTKIISYKRNKGVYPNPSDLKKWIFSSFLIKRRYELHPFYFKKLDVVSTSPNQKIQPHQITDEGGWIYSSDSGDIRINCSLCDSKGIPYSSW
jgi:hypothetical protein